MAVTLLLVFLCALQSFGDAATHDELTAENAHTLGDGLAYDGLAESVHQPADHRSQGLRTVVVQGDDFPGEHQCPGGRVDEH